MKHKTTRKAVAEANSIKVGYCDLQSLLKYHDAVCYNAGIYGWNFDVYHVYGLNICTGYRNLGGRDAVGVEEYENKAHEILSSDIPHDEKEIEIEYLLQEFCLLNGGY